MNINPIYYNDQNTLALSLLPISKRLPILFNYITELLKPVAWLNNKDTEYIYGSTYSYYVTASVYKTGDRVNGGPLYNNNVYECISSGTISHVELSATSSWYLYQICNIGMAERYNYMNQLITMEWLLNRWYNTTFRQPTGLTSWGTHSDIYILNNAPASGPFLMGETDDFSSTMGSLYSSSYMPLTDAYEAGYSWFPNNYTVHIPNTLNYLGTHSFTNVIDKYNYESITYTLTFY